MPSDLNASIVPLYASINQWFPWRSSTDDKSFLLHFFFQIFKMYIFIAIFGFCLKYAIKWVQTSLVLVQYKYIVLEIDLEMNCYEISFFFTPNIKHLKGQNAVEHCKCQELQNATATANRHGRSDVHTRSPREPAC